MGKESLGWEVKDGGSRRGPWHGNRGGVVWFVRRLATGMVSAGAWQV